MDNLVGMWQDFVAYFQRFAASLLAVFNQFLQRTDLLTLGSRMGLTTSSAPPGEVRSSALPFS